MPQCCSNHKVKIANHEHLAIGFLHHNLASMKLDLDIMIHQPIYLINQMKVKYHAQKLKCG
jgi:hypothetical protein